MFTTDMIENETVTNDLSGDKIERLLYNAGFDAEYKEGPEGLPVLEVRGGDVVILVSEPWAGDGTWFISPGTVSVEKVVDGRYTSSIFPVIKTEEDLVEAVEEFSETE